MIDRPFPAHTCPSLFRYLRKVFDFSSYLATLRDARQDPDIPPAAVFQAVFYSFVFRLPSFLQLQAELAAESHLRLWLGLDRPFGDDTLRYSLASFDLEPLEQMLVTLNRRLKRNKVFDQGRVAGGIVAALDGVEVLSSYSRCCEFCLERQVVSRDPQGQPLIRTQYYHPLVGCQIVSSRVKPFLALEWVRPGEGELTAGLRLLQRLPALYGSRCFDILLLDALYAQAPVLALAQKTGWDLVIALKQENRDLYQDAQGLFAARPPDQSWAEQQEGKTTAVRLWEEEQLPFTQAHPQPVRVVCAQEAVTQNRRRGDHLQSETTHHHWMWITTLESSRVPARQLRRLGHARWKVENNGWNDLTQNWAFKHGFLHACKHRPQQRLPSGQRQPVPNHGLAAVTLILCIAFLLSSAFALRHSKIYRLYHPTLLEIARQLYRSLYRRHPPIRGPTPRG